MTVKMIQSKQSNSIVIDTKFETVDSRKIILNDILDLIEILFAELKRPKRNWEDQSDFEFEADISNRIDVLREMVGKI